MATPLSIIGGFLGSGKTTLLNRLLVDNEGVRFGVLVNDFGDLAIDEELIASHKGDTIALSNGCVCCSISSDLMQSLVQLVALAPDHIVIEASGVSDPGRLRDLAHLDRALDPGMVVVLVDAAQIIEQSNDPFLSDTVERQLSSADTLILNKCDLVSDLEPVRSFLASRVGHATKIETSYGDIPSAALLTGTTNTSGKVKTDFDLAHDSFFRSFTLNGPARLTQEKFERNCRTLPESLLRMKGFLKFEGESRFCEVQWSSRRLDIKASCSNQVIDRLVVVGTTDLPEPPKIADVLGLSY